MRLTPEIVEQLAVFVPEQDLRRLRALTTVPGRWLPGVFGMSATTIAPFVCFRNGSFDPSTPRGLALIAHEAYHLRQVREMGWFGFYGRYFIGQFRAGFKHGSHPLEIPAINLQRVVALRVRGDGPPLRGTDTSV
ncbi:MAG: DUF4157 domain-containing protein [Anaerolineaceae bacterium]